MGFIIPNPLHHSHVFPNALWFCCNLRHRIGVHMHTLQVREPVDRSNQDVLEIVNNFQHT